MSETRTGAGNGREFIRHTADVPIEFTRVDEPATSNGDAGAAGEHAGGHSLNVGLGGLAFEADVCPSVGEVIELCVPAVQPPFVAQARVVWCHPRGERYLVGAEFLVPGDAFRSRMVEQVCAIEKYRRDVQREEGRSLTRHEAAAEWVRKYAGRFPGGSASG